jgi:hypothetical protein
MVILSLTSETRYILCLEPDATQVSRPFATAAYLQEVGKKHLFHRLCFQNYGRDAPADGFRERIPETVWELAFVSPNATTLRGLMGLELNETLGIDPGLEFAWPHDRIKEVPSGSRFSESVVLSVPTITA